MRNVRCGAADRKSETSSERQAMIAKLPRYRVGKQPEPPYLYELRRFGDDGGYEVCQVETPTHHYKRLLTERDRLNAADADRGFGNIP